MQTLSRRSVSEGGTPDRLEMDAVESLELTRVRRLPDSCRTQRWEGSRPRPAAAGLFPKPSVFVDRVIGIRL
jgi:hypothetical protein